MLLMLLLRFEMPKQTQHWLLQQLPKQALCLLKWLQMMHWLLLS
jgi:hypothetical protein